MPFTDFSYFYGEKGALYENNKLFQCPLRAFLISTFIIPIIRKADTLFQCPPRAFLISTANSFKVSGFGDKVSMPFTGFSYFYPSWIRTSHRRQVLFQCPSRAFLISTAASATPCKHCLPGPVFAGIYLNILTNPGFREIFGMFTLCSYFSFSNCIDSVLWIISFKILYLIFADQKSTSDNYFLSLY